MLGGIAATAELVRARPGLSPASVEDLDAILAQTHRAAALIRQLLAFARQDFLRPRLLSPHELVRALAPLLARTLGPAHRLDLVAAPTWPVRVDPDAVERSLLNLVSNAREALAAASGPGRQGRVVLGTGSLGPADLSAQVPGFVPPARYSLISVEDDGPGIDPAIAARIFEPFFTTRPTGHGLGLSCAFGLVKQSGGFLLQDRGPMGGARFRILLPAAAAATGAALAPAARHRPGAVILLAEDDLLLRMASARGLERLGYRVRQAADAEAARARLALGRPDLLIADLRLGSADGLTLAREARRLHPGLPILLVSGHADEVARARLDGIGLPLLPKPYGLRELGRDVAALIGAAPRLGNPT